MNAPFPLVFEPIRIGAKVSRNRVLRLGTTTNTGANGIASERTVAFYRGLARGGTGAIVTESMRVASSRARAASHRNTKSDTPSIISCARSRNPA